MACCITQTFHYCDKIPKCLIELKEGNYLFWLIVSEISVHSPWLFWFWVDSESQYHDRRSIWQMLLTSIRQEVGEGEGLERGKYKLQRHTLNWPTPPTRPYLLTFPPPPKIVPPGGVKAFNTWASWGNTSYPYHNRWFHWK
jgi:hypothetical protein